MFVLWMFIGDKTLQLCHAHCILEGDKNAKQFGIRRYVTQFEDVHLPIEILELSSVVFIYVLI